MKATINVNEKFQDKQFGSFGASCSIELEIDQGALAKPDDVLAQLRFAGDLARAAVNRELELQHRHGSVIKPAGAPAKAPAREAGSDDDWQPADDRDPGDRGYQPAPQDDERSSGGYSQYRPAESGGNNDRRGKKNWKTDGGRPNDPRQLYGFANDWGEVQWFTNLGKAQSPRFDSMFQNWTKDQMQFALDEWFKKRAPNTVGANRNGNGRY